MSRRGCGPPSWRRTPSAAEEDAERRGAETRLAPDAPDAETRALRELQGRASLGRYVTAFADGAPLDGAERELAEHRGLSTAGNVMPWDALLPPPGGGPAELRADAVTPAPASGNPVNQAEIIQRVFARTAVRGLGVAMPSVGVGVASYPVITAGQSASFAAKGGAVEAAAGTITPNTLEPKRLQARVTFRIEDAMITGGLESAGCGAVWRSAAPCSPQPSTPPSSRRDRSTSGCGRARRAGRTG